MSIITLSSQLSAVDLSPLESPMALLSYESKSLTATSFTVTDIPINGGKFPEWPPTVRSARVIYPLETTPVSDSGSTLALLFLAVLVVRAISFFAFRTVSRVSPT